MYTVEGRYGQNLIQSQDVALLADAIRLAEHWQSLVNIEVLFYGRPAIAKHLDHIEIRVQSHGPGIEMEWDRAAAGWVKGYDVRDHDWPQAHWMMDGLDRCGCCGMKFHPERAVAVP